MSKPLKVFCSRENCTGIVCYIYGSKMVSAKRGRQLFEILGNEYSAIIPCPKNCGSRVSIICTKGKINFDNLRTEEVEEKPEEENLDVNKEEDEQE